LVLANKAPVSSVASEEVAELAFLPVSSLEPRRVYYEATVGAGLPVIRTLQSLGDVGDSVVKVEAMLSGTLSFLLSDMTHGMAAEKNRAQTNRERKAPREDEDDDQKEEKEEEKEEEQTTDSPSEVAAVDASIENVDGGQRRMAISIERAMKLGLTEPDPCMDMSGLDVARKGLILGRLISEDANSLSMEDVILEPMSKACKYSVGSNAVGVIHAEDTMGVERQVEASVQDGSTLRYVAVIEAHGTTSSKRVKVQIGLKRYNADHPFGEQRNGNSGGASPENVVVVHTSMYNEHPLVIRGPGAGTALTASAVLSDVLRCVSEK
jgi:homoserine dehydrogenase